MPKENIKVIVPKKAEHILTPTTGKKIGNISSDKTRIITVWTLHLFVNKIVVIKTFSENKLTAVLLW